MKKILLLAFTIFSISSAFSQANRLVLVEEFTQASCPPCETTTPALNAIMASNADQVVQLRYHTSWPGVDPMNEDNPGEVQARVDYYGVQGVPNLLLDGVDTGVPGTASQDQINNASAQMTPISIAVTHELSEDLSTISAAVTITNEGDETYEMATNRLRVAIIEEEVNWVNRPGSTSLVDFHAVMKTFLTGTQGMEIPAIAAGDSYTMTWEDEAMPSRIYNYNKVAVVAFVQNDANRSIAQSGMSHAVDVEGFGNLSLESTTTLSDDFCDADITPTINITNTGDTAIDEYTVLMYNNGFPVQTKQSEGPIGAGESFEIAFDEMTLPAGTSTISFGAFTTQTETAILDNATMNATTGKVGEVVEMLERGFENETVSTGIPASGTIVDVPFSLINFTVVDQALLGGNTPLGGYGESAKSVSVNFWNWDISQIDPNGYMIIADQYLAPEDLLLSFDYAYTSWSGSQDRLIVEISSDCGATFEQVFNEAGSQLATAPELNANNARFTPTANQWRTVETDLSSYAGETILVRFRVVSGYGDMMYIDNIEMKTATDINELEDGEFLNVFPNPAHSYVNVELSTPNAAQVQLRVIDMLGRTVKSENLGNVSGKINHTLDVSTIPNGSYLVLLNVDGRDVVKRLSIANY